MIFLEPDIHRQLDIDTAMDSSKVGDAKTDVEKYILFLKWKTLIKTGVNENELYFWVQPDVFRDITRMEDDIFVFKCEMLIKSVCEWEWMIFLGPDLHWQSPGV